MGEIYRPCFTREQAHMHSFASAKPSTLSPRLKTKQKQTKHTHTHQTNKHKLWFFTCLFVHLPCPALQITLNNWYYAQCWSFLLNCGSYLSYVMIQAQHKKSWSGEVCSLSGREGAGPKQ